MQVTSTLDTSQLDAMIAKLNAAATNMTRPMRAVGRVLEQHIRQTFRDETDPWGSPWPPHSPVTLAARRSRGNASIQKLIDTAAMYDSLRSDATTRDVTVVIGEGLPDERAPANQFGAADRNLPARPFFPIRPGNRADIPQSWWPNLIAPLDDMLVQATQ